MRLSALGALAPTLIGSAQAAPQAAPADLTPPPDLFDAQLLDLDFWVKPRTLTVTRPASWSASSRYCVANAPSSCIGKTAK